MARANAWYLASNCTGSLMGPWISGKLIDEIGGAGLFIASFASCALVLLAWLVIGGRTSGAEESLTAVEAGRQAA
jgi:hypothetical protein